MLEHAKIAATLSFDLDEREIEFKCAVAGSDLAAVVWSLMVDRIHVWIKHGGHGCETPEDAFTKVRNWLREGLEDRGINIDDLVR